MLDLLKSLIACASVTPEDAGCQAIVGDRLRSMGFSVEDFSYGGVTNLWATHGEGVPLVCLAGHTDVVPAGPLDAWQTEPFKATIVGEELRGRGAADMKASVAAMVCSLEAIAATGHRGTIALLLTSDEEGPGIHGTKHVLNRLAEQGTAIDSAIVGEPTCELAFGDTIKNGRRGSMNGRLVVFGTQGHTAYPQLADNAIHRLVQIGESMISFDWGTGNGSFPPTTFQISNISGGTGATNVVPGSAEMQFNVRFGTDWTSEELETRIRSLVSEWGDRVTVEFVVSAQPFVTTDSCLVDTISRAVEAETGRSPKLSSGGGTSDARFFAAHGIPVIEFGPLNATIHAANESVRIADLERLKAIYIRVVTALTA